MTTVALINQRYKYQCKTCLVIYRTLKPNFHKSQRHKSGYSNECKKCKNESIRKDREGFSEEKKEEIRKRNTEKNREHRKTEKFKQTVENYKERRKVLRNRNRFFKRQLERVLAYEKKFYWTEEQSWYKNDIQPHEY